MKKYQKLTLLALTLLATITLFAFLNVSVRESFSQEREDLKDELIDPDKNPNIVQVVSTGMNFNLPDEIPSGWTTFQYKNKTPDVHFFILEKMPKGKRIEDTKAEILPIFQDAMDLINEGKTQEGFKEFGRLPEWFFEVAFVGGPGLISPGNTAETTLNLEPGYYLLECYVKMPNGVFHSMHGMLEEIRVTEANSGNKEPKTKFNIDISSTNGIQFEKDFRPGKHTFAVNFKDQIAHENFMGHDVHLVRLEENANLAKLNSWMNWANPNGFKMPIPEGVEFLGGTQELPAGNTSYFTALLKPGNYAFIAEVPDPMSKGMLKTFSVPANEVTKK